MREIDTEFGDFGFWTKAQKHGKGLGMLIAEEVFNCSFEHCGIKKIKYPVDKRNLASVKIIDGLGGKIVTSFRTGQKDCLDINKYHVDKAVRQSR